MIGHGSTLSKPPYRRGEKAGLASEGESPEQNGRLGSIIENAFEDGNNCELGKRKGPDEDGIDDDIPFDSFF